MKRKNNIQIFMEDVPHRRFKLLCEAFDLSQKQALAEAVALWMGVRRAMLDKQTAIERSKKSRAAEMFEKLQEIKDE